jgi:hypothetical protein
VDTAGLDVGEGNIFHYCPCRELIPVVQPRGLVSILIELYRLPYSNSSSSTCSNEILLQDFFVRFCEFLSLPCWILFEKYFLENIIIVMMSVVMMIVIIIFSLSPFLTNDHQGMNYYCFWLQVYGP